jgi:preprotein translocase subunit SecG
MSIYNYITIGTTFLLIILILLQTRGASLGAGMGGGGEVNTVRRGSDKSLHQITIVLVIIFAVSLLLGII